MVPSNVGIQAGSGTRHPLGGHIHFNTTNGPAGMRRADISHGLDNYLMPIMALVSDEEPWRRRRNTSYGQLGQWNTQMDTHGGMEYRSPPSWLVSRGVTEAVLSMAFVVADAAQNGELPHLDFGNNRAGKQAYQQLDKEYFRRHIPQVFQEIAHAPLYRKYEKQIQSLNAMVRLGVTWKENMEVLARWGVRDSDGTLHVSTTSQAGTPGGWPNPATPTRVFASGDAHVEGLVSPYHSRYTNTTRPEVFIYGMSDIREGDVAVAGPTDRRGTVDNLVTVLEARGLTVVRNAYGTAGGQQNTRVTVGLSHGLRSTNRTMCRRVIEAALGITQRR
jgi:hypothetical protein